MSPEMTALTYTILLMALIWIPYILNTIAVRGLTDAVGYPEQPKPLAPWAQRLKAAHYNGVENLVLFAPAVLMLELADLGNQTTAIASLVFLVARIVHALAYTLAVPYLRTGAFAVGLICLLLIVLRLLGG